MPRKHASTIGLKSGTAEYQRVLREADRAKHRLNRQLWREANREKIRAQNKAWYQLNKEKLRAGWNLRDKRKSQADGSYTPEDVDRIMRSQRGRCAICRTKLGNDFHRDHIVPLTLGGSNYPSNIQLLCPPCNLSKGSKDPTDHMRSLGLLI